MNDAPEPRDPESGDLLKICAALNEAGARYIVIGGMAMVLHGFNRGTEDIDLLVDRTVDNVMRLREALAILPDNAVKAVRDTDIHDYGVVRVADEVVVDLMGSACGVANFVSKPKGKRCEAAKRKRIEGKGSKARGTRFEVRGLRYSVRGLRYSVRGQRAEVRGRMAETSTMLSPGQRHPAGGPERGSGWQPLLLY